MDDSFDLAIKDHLELQRRNRMLEAEMPLSEYRDGPPIATNGHAAATPSPPTKSRRLISRPII